VLLPPVMLFKLTMFGYDCIDANFAKGFLFKQQDRQEALSQLLSTEPYNHICRNFWQLWFTRKFCTILHYYSTA